MLRKPPITLFPTPFYPLDKANLGKAVAQALLETPLCPLPPPERFSGAGLYAIYYAGDHPAYRWLVEKNAAHVRYPIYIGQKVNDGARKGISSDNGRDRSPLWDRLSEHASSINATDLVLADFQCRYLVVDETFIGLGERLLLQSFRPLWNAVIDGFGNHDPGRGRHRGERPRWDVLHPGRKWADNLAATRSSDQVLDEVRQFVTADVVPPDVEAKTSAADG